MRNVKLLRSAQQQHLGQQPRFDLEDGEHSNEELDKALWQLNKLAQCGISLQTHSDLGQLAR